MNQSRRKTKFLVLVTMFCSIQVILMLTPLGYIPLGPVRATTMHIPVILAGILLGIKGGAITGFVLEIIAVTFGALSSQLVPVYYSEF